MRTFKRTIAIILCVTILSSVLTGCSESDNKVDKYDIDYKPSIDKTDNSTPNDTITPTNTPTIIPTNTPTAIPDDTISIEELKEKVGKEGKVIVTEDDFALLNINLTRKKSTANTMTDGLVGIFDLFTGTNMNEVTQQDVAVYMDDELIDIIPYNEEMRGYTFQVEKNSMHFLKIEPVNFYPEQSKQFGNLMMFNVYDNSSYTYKIETSVDATVRLQDYRPETQEDYLSYAEIILVGCAVAAGSAYLIHKIDKSGIFEESAEVKEEIKRKEQAAKEQYEQNKKEEDAKWERIKEDEWKRQQDEIDRRLAEKKYKDAEYYYNKLKSNDPTEYYYDTRSAKKKYEYLKDQYYKNY